MAKRGKKQSTAEVPQEGRVARMRSAIGRQARRLSAKIRHPRRQKEEPAMESAPRSETRRAPQSAARRVNRQTDVPLDLISRTYSPMQTSRKGPFRSNGDDHSRDQELAGGFSDERWNDEDRITNKSDDPRIGTHRRTYEPNEKRGER